MKKIIATILFTIFLATSVGAQELYLQKRTERRNKTISTLAIQVGSVALNAVGDALLDRGRYEGNQNMMAWGHVARAGSIATLLTVPLVIDDKKDFLPFIGSYIFIRAATFDPIYNSVRGVDWNYHGNTSYWDRAWNKAKMPPHGEAWIRTWALTVGFAIQINYN